MREEGAVFGGEVSGHYYFRDFWNADSGTIPALLMLELLSVEGRSLGELMAEFRSRYFISGEINSEVADPAAKMEEIAERYSDGEQIDRLDGISVDYPDWHFNVRPSNTEPLLRLNLESLVSREDMERQARRDARADPGVTLTPEQALEQAALAGIHCLRDPDPVRGRAGQLLPDRGRAADPGRHRPQLGQGARRAAAAAGRARPLDRRPRAGRRSPTSTSTTSAWSRSSSSTPAPRSRRSASPPSGSPTSTRTPRREDALRGRADAPQRHPRGRDRGAAQRLAQLPRLGLARDGDPTARATARCSPSATARLQALHRPGHSPSDTVFWDAERRILIAADHLIAHISSNPLISRPLDGSGRAAAGAGHLHRVDAQDARDAGRDRPLRPRRADHRPRRPDRRPPRHPRAAQGEDLQADRRKRPRTGYELAQAIWGNVAVTQAFLTLSEVIGHADLLINEGRVREVDDGSVDPLRDGSGDWGNVASRRPSSPSPR